MLDAERDERRFVGRQLDGCEARGGHRDTEQRNGNFRERPADRTTTNVR